MMFGAIFKKETKKPAETSGFQPRPVLQMQKMTEKHPLDTLDFESDFESEMDAPDKLLAEEIFETSKNVPQAPPINPNVAQKTAQPQAVQKIPAFVSLDKYKEIRLSLRDIKVVSAEMRRTLDNLRQNRDSGITLLNTTIGGLERIEGNIDKIRSVLRT